MVRVAILDDQPVVRRGLAAILGSCPDVTVVGMGSRPQQLPWTGNGRIAADVVICDLFLGESEPSLATIRALADELPVVVISTSAHSAHALAAASAGASAYLDRSISEEALIAAVRSVAAGRFLLGGQLGEVGGPNPRREVVDPYDNKLSEREQETLAYIAAGLTHRQTADKMGVTKATVDTYVERVRNKLQVRNKAELTLAAVRHIGRQHWRLLGQAS